MKRYCAIKMKTNLVLWVDLWQSHSWNLKWHTLPISIWTISKAFIVFISECQSQCKIFTMGGDKDWLNSDESSPFNWAHTCNFTVSKCIKCLGLGVHVLKKKHLKSTKPRISGSTKMNSTRAGQGTVISWEHSYWTCE